MNDITKDSVFGAEDDSVFTQNTLYKLKFYDASGKVRVSISRSIALDVGKKWGDIIKAIADQKWYTKKEIVKYVKEQERRNPLTSSNRSESDIESAIANLIECGVMVER